MSAQAIALFAHGSSVESANEAVRTVAKDLARATGIQVEAAFLELGQPDLAGAVDRLVSHGATDVVVVPYFLTLGIHMQRDLPRIISNLEGMHSGVHFTVAKPLDGHPALLKALADRAAQATNGSGKSESASD